MNRPTPVSHEAEQRHYDRSQIDRQYSYDLTKQLTFFVISAEIVFCGYILLNAEVLGVIKHSSALFLLAGIAALCGIFWRVCYNEIYHDTSHELKGKHHDIIKQLNSITYFFYFILSILFFISLLITGYQYLSAIESKTNDLGEQKQPSQTQQLNKEIQTTLESGG
jgi:hypothetical protein